MKERKEEMKTVCRVVREVQGKSERDRLGEKLEEAYRDGNGEKERV